MTKLQFQSKWVCDTMVELNQEEAEEVDIFQIKMEGGGGVWL